MDKNRQEPFVIETVGGGADEQDKPLGTAVGFLKQKLAIIFGKGGDEAGKRLFSNNYEEIAEDKGPVKVLNLSSGMQYDKDRNYKNMAPGKKMSQKLFNWACETIEKLKERILDTIPVFSKRIMMGAAIALTTASIFAGGLGNDARSALKDNYSTLNPKFSDGYETLIEIDGSNKDLAGKYMADFIVEVLNEKIRDFENKNGNLSPNFNKQALVNDYASILTDSINVDVYANDGGKRAVIYFNQKDLDDFDAILERASEHGKKKDSRILNDQPSNPPDPKNISAYGGRINTDNSITFEYRGATSSSARQSATNLYAAWMNECVEAKMITNKSILDGVSNARNNIKVEQVSEHQWVASITISPELAQKMGLGSDAKTKTHHPTTSRGF